MKHPSKPYMILDSVGAVIRQPKSQAPGKMFVMPRDDNLLTLAIQNYRTPSLHCDLAATVCTTPLSIWSYHSTPSCLQGPSNQAHIYIHIYVLPSGAHARMIQRFQTTTWDAHGRTVTTDLLTCERDWRCDQTDRS